MNNNIVNRSIDLHLYFMRILKEHMIFIEASFTPQNFGYKDKASVLKEKTNNFLSRIVGIANENVSPKILSSEQIVTKYTLDAEDITSYFTKIPIDTSITKNEYKLIPYTNNINKISESEIMALNNEAAQLTKEIIEYKNEVLDLTLKCSIFTTNFPLLLKHITEEAEYYLRKIEELQKPNIVPLTTSLIQEEIFWNNIMREHALFFRGLLDPSEKDLINISNTFANTFENLIGTSKSALQNAYNMATVTNNSLMEASKTSEFKRQATEGLLNCKIKGTILPLLADHVLREANRYVYILETLK